MLPVWLSDEFVFPDPARAHPRGLVALGGGLETERLVAAYRRGIFPWYGENDPPMWWSPDPRTVFLPETFHLSRSLLRQLRKNPVAIRIDTAFDQVVAACATAPRPGQDGTWIVPEIRSAYLRLHEAGVAHSFEVWQCVPEERLVGGVYGVATGAIFCGESMFSGETGGSKTALAALMHFALASGIRLVDCQFLTGHLASLGAFEISRAKYLRCLEEHAQAPAIEPDWRRAGAPLFADPDWPKRLLARQAGH